MKKNRFFEFILTVSLWVNVIIHTPIQGQEHVRANPMMKDGKVLEFLEEDNRTLHSNFLKGLERSEGGPCLGWRPAAGKPYEWITYQQVTVVIIIRFQTLKKTCTNVWEAAPLDPPPKRHTFGDLVHKVMDLINTSTFALSLPWFVSMN